MTMLDTTPPSDTVAAAPMTHVSWERLWRASGLAFVVMVIVASFISGDQPNPGASAAQLESFHDGNRGRILLAAVLSGGALLFLLWFAAAITSTLRDAGQGLWGAAATASSTAIAAMLFVLIALRAAFAYAPAGSGSDAITTGLNDLGWSLVVLTSFPAAMLIMAGTFGLWQAGVVTDALFRAGLVAVVLVLMGGTTWATSGFWAPDGAYARIIIPVVALGWVAVISGLLSARWPAPENQPALAPARGERPAR